MKSHILVVAADQELLYALKDSIEISSDHIALVTASDGLVAMEKLKTSPVNIVVTDHRLPRMDGLSLAGEISRNYPDIPVFFITGHGGPQTEQGARETGVAEYITKPLKIDELIGKLIVAVQKQSDGGTLHNVNPATFLQMIKMEEQVCTIRITEKGANKQGILFIKDGDLIDARYQSLRAEAAALEIFSWDDVALQIQNSCPTIHPRIRKGLQAILMDAMLLKDERKQQSERAQPNPPPTGVDPPPSEGVKTPAITATPGPSAPRKSAIFAALGRQQAGIETMFQDIAWAPKLAEFCAFGDIVDCGRLKVAYIAKNNTERLLILPERDYTVIAVNAKCHRDDLMTRLARLV